MARNTSRGTGFRMLALKGERVVASDLIRAEIRSAAWRYVRADMMDEDEAMGIIDDALDLVDEFIPLEENAAEAFAEAVRRTARYTTCSTSRSSVATRRRCSRPTGSSSSYAGRWGSTSCARFPSKLRDASCALCKVPRDAASCTGVFRGRMFHVKQLFAFRKSAGRHGCVPRLQPLLICPARPARFRSLPALPRLASRLPPHLAPSARPAPNSGHASAL